MRGGINVKLIKNVREENSKSYKRNHQTVHQDTNYSQCTLLWLIAICFIKEHIGNQQLAACTKSVATVTAKSIRGGLKALRLIRDTTVSVTQPFRDFSRGCFQPAYCPATTIKLRFPATIKSDIPLLNAAFDAKWTFAGPLRPRQIAR